MANNEIFCKGAASISLESRCSASPILSLTGILYLFSSSDGWLKGMLFALEPTGFPGEKHTKGGASQVRKA